MCIKVARMIELLWLPLLAGIGTALIAGPLGCFVVWQRMAYFGESLAHSALLGVAIGLWLHLPVTFTVIGAGILLALLLAGLQQSSQFSSDTLLGILSHTLLAGGLVLLATLPNLRVNLDALLFGDLLAVSHEELAQAEGVNVARVRTLLMLMMALTVAVAMKVVGVLLMTSLLVIPAAIAQRHARSPEQMACIASLIGVLAIVGGLLLSWFSNSPVGPSIVLAAGIFFLNALLVHRCRQRFFHST
jgi:zinc transport system permease protein